MSHKARWRRWLPPLLSALLLASVAVVPARAAYQATIDSNVSAFQPPCVGYFDSLPTRMLNAAKAAYTALGYSASAFSGASFTRAHTLSRTVNDWGYYVHSHGDYYWYAPPTVRYVPLADATRRMKVVQVDCDTVLTARDLGMCLGD